MIKAGNFNKKLILVVAAAAVVILGVGIVNLISKNAIRVNPAGESPEAKATIYQKLEERPEQKKEEEKVVIKRIEDKIKGELAGNNNEGTPYIKESMVVRQVTEEEHYGVSIGLISDKYNKMEQTKKSSYELMGRLFKAVYTSGEKVGTTHVNLYISDKDIFSGYKEALSVFLDQETANKIDWNQDQATLFLKTIPSVWRISTIDTYYKLFDVE